MRLFFLAGKSDGRILRKVVAVCCAQLMLCYCYSYFGKQTTPKVINNFYDEVASKSPLPIVIYNFPAVCNGVDLDSEVMIGLARKHKNIGTLKRYVISRLLAVNIC